MNSYNSVDRNCELTPVQLCYWSTFVNSTNHRVHQTESHCYTYRSTDLKLHECTSRLVKNIAQFVA